MLLATIAGIIAPSAPAQAVTPTTTCSFNSNAGTPNPLGMRTLVTLTEMDGNTTVKYEQLPTPVGGTVAATIASERELILYKTNVAQARQLFLSDPKYYNELRGSSDGDGFKAVNDTLICQSTSGSTPSPTGGTVSALPDGSYRFWNGKATGVLSSDQLLKQGGVLFLFNKRGNQIVGTFGQIDNEGSCVKGTVNGNTFTGVAIPYEPSPNPASRSNTSFDPGGFLKLGRWKKVGNQNQYENSTLDLSRLNRINLGSRKPSSSCP
ncbi:MAG: hypothetical protein KME13_04465 [Myxacorys californica WJT36-NPBG1]|nr:hypothetical protein [Myxacorys californica WJT36-NPBG1]